jgi:hypothetical protein
VSPLAPERYKVQFTVGRDTYDKLQRAQALLRHVVPNGDPAVIIDRALTVLLAQHVPADVRRAVWARDRSQCAFVGLDGRRCQERGFLELHHTAPYAAGGDATVSTIELRCRAHNLHEAEIAFGPSVRHRPSARNARTTTSS